MTKFYLIGGALFIGSLLSIEIMNVIDASKMQKLNDQMSAKYYEKKGYAKGGAVKKMMGGGAAGMKKKGFAKGGAIKKMRRGGRA